MRFWIVLILLFAASVGHAQVVINEVLADNHFTVRDEAGESSDWVELLNTGEESAQLGGYSLSDSVDELRKWTFPELGLGPGERLLVWCSGEDRIFAAAADVLRTDFPLPLEATPIPPGAEWSYLPGGPTDGGVPRGWNRADSDDSNWLRGELSIGFGTEGIRTELPIGTSVVLLRREFTLDTLSSRPLVLQVAYDDGFAAFLNGVLVAAENYPVEEELTFSSLAIAQARGGDPARYVVSGGQPPLTTGKNVLAIALLNRRATGPGSADLWASAQLGFAPRVLHTNFKLGRNGEGVFLVDPAGDLVDGVQLPAQTEDHAFGRLPDGTGDFHYLPIPTPLEPNRGPPAATMIPEEPSFEPVAAVYSGPVMVTIAAAMPFGGGEIRYTIDGRPPSPASTKYERSFRLEEDTVVRAAVFLDGQQVTREVANSYFVSELAQDLELPILSLAMPPEDFEIVHSVDRTGRDFERAAYVEFFDGTRGRTARTGVGMRLHGGAGRNGGLGTKKSYRLYFRDDYGEKELRYAVIPDTAVDTFDKLVLRSGYNDAFRSGGAAAYIRDQLIRDLHEDMGGVVSHGHWYNLFVNMEYRGVYNVTERMDEVFFATYFPDDGENWDVVKQQGQPLHGSALEWEALVDLFFASCLTEQSLYEDLSQRIDLGNFTSYMLVNLWAHNTDWPHNNWYAAKPRRADGQWLFLSWDAERSVGASDERVDVDSLARLLGAPGPSAFVLRSLLENVHYQSFFLEELGRYVEGPLAAKNVLAHIDRVAALIDHDMQHEAALSGASREMWRQTIDGLRAFASARAELFHARTLGSPRLRSPRVLSVDPSLLTPEGEVQVTLFGENFTAATEVRVGTLPSSDVEFLSSGELRALVPFALELEGFPTITVSDGRLSNITTEALEVSLVRPVIVRLEPASGLSGGGETILIVGRDFTPGVRVEFGGRPAPAVVRESRELLRVSTPAGTGRVNVRAINTRPGDLPSLGVSQFTYVASSFVRGDVDGDRRLDISDAIQTVSFLVGRDELNLEVLCVDAFDADDSGAVQLTDALRLLKYLFDGSSPALPAPFPHCGRDETPDSLTCSDGVACSGR